MFKRTGYLMLLLITLCCMSIVNGVVSAQSLFVHELDHSYFIKTPTTWTLGEDRVGGGFLAEGEGITLRLVTPRQVTGLFHLTTLKSARLTASSVIIKGLAALDDVKITEPDLKTVTFADYSGVSWEYSVETSSEGMVMVLEIPDEGYLYLDFMTGVGGLDEAYSKVESIIATLTVIPLPGSLTATPAPDTATAGRVAGVLGSKATPSVTVTTEPCLVSAVDADTARLRVGPGENRSAIAFLPPDQNFRVTGRFVTEDDSVWFQLDKAEVAPTSSAAELWVAQVEINASGGCDAVTDASAPPIVPIIAGGGSSGSSGSTDSAGNTTPGTLPTAGTWTMNLESTMYASCLNTNTISFPTTEFFTRLSFPVSVAISSDGVTIIFDGVALGQIAPSSYVGSFDVGGGDNFQIYLTVNSANSMGGRLVGNTTVNGLGCSITANFGVSR